MNIYAHIKRRLFCPGILAAIVLSAVFGSTGCARSGPVSQSAFLLDTYITVTIYDQDGLFQDTNREEALEGSIELCRHYDQLFSKTQETSEIYAINHREPGTESMTVSEDTARMLEKGLEYSRISQGAFDITIQPLSSLWDFKSQNPTLPDPQALKEAAEQVDYRNIIIEGNQIHFLSDQVQVDPGAIAKGYIADRMKEYLEEQGIESAVINLGGNVLCLGERPDGTPFRIGLRKPFGDSSETAGILDVNGMSVVSSGVYERHFEIDGVNYHHLLNPDTGWPWQNGLTQVTIISPESVDGDGLSTVCFGLGLEQGIELLNTMDDICGIFMTEDGTIYGSQGAQEYLEDEDIRIIIQ